MKLIVDMGTRKVFWEIPDQAAGMLLNTLVQTFGPAKGEYPEDAT